MQTSIANHDSRTSQPSQTPSRGQTAMLLPQFETDNRQQLAVINYKTWIPSQIYPSSPNYATDPMEDTSPAPRTAQINQGHAGERCNRENLIHWSGFYSQLFTILKKDGGIRPVFNLRRLNAYLTVPHFKMEWMTHVPMLVRQNDYMTSIDLSDAFSHVPIHPASPPISSIPLQQPIIPVQSSAIRLGVYTMALHQTHQTDSVLSTSPRRGIRLSAYLDDWIKFGKTIVETREHTRRVMAQLTQLGWKVSQDKSVTTPTQQLQHLRFQIDTMRICTAMPAVFPTNLHIQALMAFKNMYVKHPRHWDTPQTLSADCIKELKWWHNHIAVWNGRTWIEELPRHTLFVDASDRGWGVVLDRQVVQQQWTRHAKQHSINWRELMAITEVYNHPKSEKHLLVKSGQWSKVVKINQLIA